MPKPVILLSIPALREKDVAVMPKLRTPDGRRRDRRTDAELSLRHLPGAGQHDHRQAARRARRGGQRVLLAREAAGRDVDRARTTASSGRRFGTCSRTTGAGLTSAVWFPHAQQGLRGRLRLHARPDPQSRRLGIALVLHPADGAVRHAPRRAGPFSADALLGTDGQHQGDAPGSPTRP